MITDGTPPQGAGWEKEFVSLFANEYPTAETINFIQNLLSSQRTLLREKIEASKVDVRRDKVSSSKGAHSEHDSLFDLGWNAALAHFATLHDEI